MTFRVKVTPDALRDLEDIDDYIARNDSPAKAEAVTRRIEEAIASLEALPHRGSHPREAKVVGEDACREIFFKPYRIIYEVRGQNVTVLVISDGRRNMQELLNRRLLASE